MSSWQDARCVFSATWAADSLAALKEMLSVENVLKAGCRVIKHPGACVLCVANNDCSRLPLHPGCRCEREPYLTSMNED